MTAHIGRGHYDVEINEEFPMEEDFRGFVVLLMVPVSDLRADEPIEEVCRLTNDIFAANDDPTFTRPLSEVIAC